MRNRYTLYRFIWMLAAAALAGTSAMAQNRIPCYTDEHFAEQVARHPELLKARADLDAKIQQMQDQQSTQRGIVATKRIIPIVFHVLYTPTGGGNEVTRAQIQAAVATLNRDFSRTNSDTLPVRFPGASMDFEFRLATKDPNGNCTDGITRHETPLSAGVDPRDAVKSVYSWPTDKYFNVWVVQNIQGTISGAQGVIAGYAQFPMGQAGLSWDTWGVVLRSDVVNASDRTLSHEIGHCFNLYHTFQGECPNTNCATQGDQVCDTPPMTLSQGCNRSQNTCSTDNPNQLDNIENFMSYDVCQNMFSPGQRARVYAAIAAVPQLQTLSSPANLIAAGVEDGRPAPGLCPPIAGFFSSRNVACGNAPITFFNNSYNAVADASTRYLWTIPGSDSGTYHTAQPQVRFTTPGYHDVTLTVSNSAGADTIVRSQFIASRPAIGMGTNPQTEDFENSSFPNVNPEFYKNWELTSTSSTTNWEYISLGGARGGVMRVRHSGITGSFSRYLTSPGLNLGAAGRLVVYFRRAHKRRANAATTDKLTLAVSTDCGSNWTGIKTWSDDATDPALQLYTTAQTQTALYVQPADNDWKLDSAIIGTRIAVANRGNVRIRFESVNSNANTLFLDDVYIGPNLPVGIRNQLLGTTGIRLEVMPNPGTSSAEIRWEATRASGRATLEIIDAAGRTIAARTFAAGTEGSLPVSALAPSLQKGVYVLRFRTESGVQATRFVLE